ncbi:MAG TPA: hypothetical protein VNW04_09915, partial [Puia sp.]|nr:hypothetical protein [Puia sp.]
MSLFIQPICSQMTRINIRLSAFAAALLLATSAFCQSNSLYSYQDLSHFYYGKQRDSLKKA